MNILNKRLLFVSLIFCTATLTGCASTFYSKISTVNQLPAGFSDKTYSLVEHPEQGKEPEYLHASEDVKARLRELGFTETEVGKGTLKVKLQLVSIPGNAHLSSPFRSTSYIITPSGMVIPIGGFEPYRFYPGFARLPYRYYPRTVFNPRYFDSMYSAFPFGNRFDPIYDPRFEVRQYFDHGIEITITEAASGKLLYSVNAKTTKTDVEIDPYIALLVESALREFPNKTGDSTVEIQLEK